MRHVAIRVEPALDDPAYVRSLFERHAPYRAVAAYIPTEVVTPDGRLEQPVLPWFRGNWALAGEPLVDGVGPILDNPHFIEAARVAFPGSAIRPKTVVVNINGPIPAGAPHTDVPSFRGATRDRFPLRFLLAMGASKLFERWQITEAGAIAWFYDGTGGNFDYWPDGPKGPMLSEQPPFGNVAIVADNDRMYHRIGHIGEADAVLPKMTSEATIGPDSGGWVIRESGRDLATYTSSAVRMSILWKAQIVTDNSERTAGDVLSLDQIMDIFERDLRGRGVQFVDPIDPLDDNDWISLLENNYRKEVVTT